MQRNQDMVGATAGDSVMKLRNKNKIISQINTDFESYVNPHVPVHWEYRQKWSHDVKRRDGYRCNVCGSRKKIVSHHIIFKRDYPSLELNRNNGIALCQSCEDQAHGRELKQFMPNRITVPSLKQMIRDRPVRKSAWKRIASCLKNVICKIN